jgi:iron complex outermembrane recepter protein
MRTGVVGVAISLCVIGLSLAGEARALVRRDVNIPAGGLARALQVLAKDYSFQILYRTEVVGTLQTAGAIGEFSSDEALKQLLKGTGLTWRYLDEKTITLVPSAGSATGSGVGSAASGETVAPAGTANGGVLSQYLLLAESSAGQNGTTAAGTDNAVPGRERPGELEEVVVSAQKHGEERLQNVPISISVLNGSQLESPTIASVSDALNTIPGVAINQDYTGAGSVVTVRGVAIGQTVFAGSSPVAYYIDSVPFGLVRSAVAPDQDAYDLERIEVLRGPQGTLYGASALNGVVRILTNDPDLNEFDVKARGAYSNTDGGGSNYQGDLAINVPLVDGKVAARAVLGYEDNGGWINSPVASGINNEDRENFRLKINGQLTDSLSIGLSYWGSRDRWGAPSTGNDDYLNSSVNKQSVETDFDAYGLKVAYDFSGYTLTGTTSFLRFANDTVFDFTSLLDFPFLLYTGLDSEVASQEVLLNSPTVDNWRWSLGGIYRWGKESLYQDQPNLTPATGFFEQEIDASRSYAGFGEITRLFLDGSVEATLGLRQFEDHVVQHGRLFPTDPYQISDGKFNATTPRAVLTWHESTDLTLYGSYSQGFRSGFPQDVASAQAGYAPVNADKLFNYEIGAKGALFSGKLSFDLATYYMDWKGVQQTLQVPYQNIYVTAVVNGQSASGMGVDLSVTTSPTKGLVLGLTGSWNNLETNSDIYSSGVLLFHKGDRLNYSPELTGGAWGNYEFPLGATGLAGRFWASLNYTSPQRYVVNPGGPVVIAQWGDPMVIGRVGVALVSPAHWSTSLYVENVTNERGALSRALDDPDLYTRIRPRTIGLQVDYHFR